MNKKSQHLESLIEQWKKESEIELEKTQDFLKFEIKHFEKDWRLKRFRDLIFIPAFLLIGSIILFTGNKIELYFGFLPWTGFVYIIFLQRKLTSDLDKIDMGLSFMQYKNRFVEALKNELRLLKLAKKIVFPVFIICLGGEFCYYLFFDKFAPYGWVALAKILAASFLLNYISHGIDLTIQKINDFES